MRAVIQREWLQKHPTPRAGDGDFHWFPGAVDPALLAAISEGTAGDRTFWLEPGRVVCARRFAAVAPGDGRRYTGIAAVVVAAPGASAAALLAVTPLPEPAPWRAEPTEPARVPVVEPPPTRPAAASPPLVAATRLGTTAPELADPATLAAIETGLPDEVRTTARRVVLGAPAAPTAADPARRHAMPPAALAAPRRLPFFLGAALLLSLLTNLLLAVALVRRPDTPAAVHGTVAAEVDAGAVAVPVTTPDAGVDAPVDAAVVAAPLDAAPVVETPKAKPRPAPGRRRK